MSVPKSEDVKKGIAVIWENLQCPICLDLMSKPVSTQCDHQFCKFCMMKLLEKNKRKETSCPVCKTKVTKRSLQESPGFQKLVEGLNTLVQSYEFDTGTNYFTGMPQRKRGASVGTESRDQQGSEESTVSDHNVMDKSTSLSSSTAAKDAFAKLMDLEDSHPAQQSQQDCFEAATCDLLQNPENKPADVEDVPRTDLNSLPTQHQGSQDDMAQKSRKRPSRKSKRLGLDPDRIVDKRKKKSVEKVSEWLMKISPSSDIQTEGHVGDGLSSTDSEAEESAGSTASTKSITRDDKVEINPMREVQGRPLEEQVFGAVYKRDRKASTSNIRVFSPEREIVPTGHPISPTKNDRQTKRHLSKRKSGCKFPPSDCFKKVCDEEMRVQDREDADRLEESLHVKEGTEEKSNHNIGSMEESSAFSVPLKRPGRRSKMKMPDTWQDMDQDLTASETNRKRRLTRSNCEGAIDNSKECKNARYAKSLALVSAGTETIMNNPKLVETEVTIESYPSSPDPKPADGRMTRRSLKLQEFTAEVQGRQKSKKRRSKLALPKASNGSENAPSSGPNQTNMDNLDNKDASHAGQTEKAERFFRTNGCVFTNDLENIEAVQATEDSPVVPCVSDINEENTLVSVVPDTGDQDRPRAPCSNVVINSPSSLEAAIPDTSIPDKHQESPLIAVVAPESRISVGALVSAGQDEVEANDSELDTEQLMKTFKATTRRSFCLGSPRTVMFRKLEKSPKNLTVEHESKDQTEPEDVNSDLAENDQSSEFLPLNLCNQPLHKNSPMSHESFLETNVSSVGLLQSGLSRLSKKSQQDNFPASGTSESLALSPNKVVKSTQGSQLPANFDPEYSCHLFSMGITQEGPQSGHSKSSEFLKALCRKPQVSKEDQRNSSLTKISISNQISDTTKGKSDVHTNNFESSVTPDGLVPNDGSQIVEPEADQTSAQDMNEDAGGEEILSQPCVPSKRRAQRLESSDSESNEENDDLPSLAQIFKSKSNRLSSQTKKVPQSKSNEDGPQDEVECQEPNPGSVLLNHQMGQCVEPKFQESHENVLEESITKFDEELPHPGCRDTWITSSQGSVDLFGTPEECEEAGGGVCVHAGLSIDSSQYSSEIINTQQKEEMQQELWRLEKMMALVSEALQKKESGESRDKPETEDDVKQAAEQECRTETPKSCRSKAPPQDLKVKDHEVIPDGVKMTDTREETTVVNEHGSHSTGKMELVASGLNARELVMVKKFAKKMQGSTSRHVTPSSTHIIIKTDADLVCERTLKYFQGIAGRKWVVSFLWISECFKQGKVLDESGFEVCGDVVNGRDHRGPRRARTTADNNLLMKGCEICFQGSFTDMTSDQMEVMVETCGATVMKDPLMFSKQGNPYQLVVVQPGPDDSQSYYTALQKKARVVTRSWLLDSIATYTLQVPEHYKA